jgi:hypothetical protein
MPSITEDLRKTLSDPTPLYALAGAGDLAVEKLREVPGKAQAIAADRKAAQDRAAKRLQEAQVKLTEAQTKVTETVSALPSDLHTLQEKAQGFALQQVGRAAELAVKARELYDELAERGKTVVDRQRKEAAGEIGSKADAFAEAVAPENGAAKAEDKPSAEKKAPAAKRTTPRKTTAAKPAGQA